MSDLRPRAATGPRQPPAEPRPPGRWAHVAAKLWVLASPAVVIGATFAVLTWVGWLRWGEMIADFGRQLYLPWQICAGKVLYRDLASTYGPLSPYFNALVFRTFGASIRTLAVANLAVLACVTVLLFRLLSEIAGRWTTTFACVVFLAVFGFGHNLGLGNYNYVFPYAYEITHGMALSLLSIALFWQYVKRGLAVRLALSGLACGLVALAKPELTLACLAAIASGLGGWWWISRPRAAACAREVGAFVGGLVVPAIVASGLFLTAEPLRAAVLAALGAWPPLFNPAIRAIPFYATGVGALHGGAGALRMLIWAALLGAYTALVWAIGTAVRRRGWPESRLAWLTGVAAFAALSWFLYPTLWIGAARPLPLLLAVCAGFALAELRRAPSDPGRGRRPLLLLVLSVFALASLAKIVFTVYLGHFGFVLAMPGALIAFVVLVEYLPMRAAELGSSRAVVRAGGVALVAVVALAHAGRSIITLRQENAALGRGSDRIMTRPAVAGDVRGMLAAVARELAPGDTLAVVPHGALINYLSGRVNPTPFLMLTPTEFANYGDTAIVGAFRAHPPDAILYLPRAEPEMGVGRLGFEYGRPLMTWIQSNYVAIARSPNPDGDAGGVPYILLRRLGSR